MLGVLWGLTQLQRVLVVFAPPLAFIAVISVARRILGVERVVFYQVALAAIGAVVAIGAMAAQPLARLIDVTVIGLGVFLVFGRLGCFSVACCHGRPARRGIVYGPAHIAAGLWQRYAGRTLWPVQLVECAACAALVLGALAIGWKSPGVPAEVFILGYALTRFALEEVRGDGTRPYYLGVSEARWCAAITAVACAAWRKDVWSVVIAVILVAAVGAVVARRRARAMFEPSHLREIERANAAALRSGQRERTTIGVVVSCHALPDGRFDCVLSSEHPAWSVEAASKLASTLWSSPEIVRGRITGLVHVILKSEERL